MLNMFKSKLSKITKCFFSGAQTATPATKAALIRRLSSKKLLEAAVDMETESSSTMHDMMERHAMELAQLENELRSEEIAKINEVRIQIPPKHFSVRFSTSCFCCRLYRT